MEYLKQLYILKFDGNNMRLKVFKNIHTVLLSTYFLLVFTWLVHYTLESDKHLQLYYKQTLKGKHTQVCNERTCRFVFILLNFLMSKKYMFKYSQGYQTHISTSFALKITSSSHKWSWKLFQYYTFWQLLIAAMMLVFLFCLVVVIAFLVGFVSNQVTVLSQTLQLAPQV